MFCCICTWAQINLREGIVITLQGDTLHGDIDYRSDISNAQRCVFLAQGESTPKTYLPGEIQSYRFMDNGRYYVSREIPKKPGTDLQSSYFLEYILRGKLSYYYLANGLFNYYLLEDENGKLILFSDRDEQADKPIRRRQFRDATVMLSQSEKAQQMLWDLKTNKYHVKQVIQTYNDETCPDGQCEVFEYANRVPHAEKYLRFTLKAGYSPVLFRRENHADSPYKRCTGIRASAGLDYLLARYSKGLFLQAYFDYCQAHQEEGLMEIDPDCEKYTFREISLKLGVGYDFPLIADKLKGRLFVGKDLCAIYHYLTYPYRYDHPEMKRKPGKNEGHLFAHNFYYGAGLTYPIGKHKLLIEADFYYKKRAEENWPTRRPSFMIGWQF